MTTEELYNIFLKHPSITTDTRKLSKGSIFFALKGENFNGNKFCKEAIEKGCAYAISDEIKDDNQIIYVKDVLKSLQDLARHHRRQQKCLVIGITGSNGKTTTKELIYSVLSQKYKTLATEGNLNNHIGVPLTLLKITDNHEIAVIEMGANKPGDIQELCEIAEPEWGLITNVGKAHLEGFGNIETTLETKTALYRFVHQNKGKIFLNYDDELLRKSCPDKNAISYSVNSNRSDIKGTLEEEKNSIVISWLNDHYHSPTLQTNLIGSYNLYNILAAVSIGNQLKMEPLHINNGIRDYVPVNNRSQIIEGKNNTLIMDAYNANPASMDAAVKSFIKRGEKKPLMILGDMFELGKYEEEEHKKIVSIAKSSEIQTFFVGEKFSKLKENNKMLSFFDSLDDIKKYLNEKPVKNRCILLKASRGIGLEQLQDLLN